jgi:two-component system cell cycle sensor histidine kinase/response regulator CckA
VTDDRPAGSPRPAADSGQSSPAVATVLVVEDDEAVRAMLALGLRQYGFAVRLAARGHEAIEIYRREKETISVVLMDVQMPDLDGPWTFIALRQINPQVRVCFMSGNTGDYDTPVLMEMGAFCVLQKPFSLAELAAVLR